MSATNRTKKDSKTGEKSKTERLGDDLYETPAWVTQALLEENILIPGNWMEPCAGRGAIMLAERNWRHRSKRSILAPYWYAVEKRADCAEPLLEFCHPLTADFLEERDGHRDNLDKLRVDVVLTNPPFSLALDFIQTCMRRWPEAMLAFLSRVNFLGSQKRAPWLREHTPDVYVLPKRPSFAHGGTDATEYAWLVWPTGAEVRREGRVKILLLPLKAGEVVQENPYRQGLTGADEAYDEETRDR
jgi:hypothetical protein